MSDFEYEYKTKLRTGIILISIVGTCLLTIGFLLGMLVGWIVFA